MNPTMQKIADQVADLPEGLREEAQADLQACTDAWKAEAETRDEETMQGLKELENGDYITIEEWRLEIDKMKLELDAKYGVK